MVNKRIEMQPVGCYGSNPRSTITDLDNFTTSAYGMESAQARRITQNLSTLNPQVRAIKATKYDSNTIMLEGITLRISSSGVAIPRLKTSSLAPLDAQPYTFGPKILQLVICSDGAFHPKRLNS